MAYNSTIKNKKQHLSCGCFDYNFSKGRCKSHAALAGKPIKRVSDKRMAAEFGSESEDNIIQDLDAVVSLYVRIRDSNANGFLKCCTCPSEIHYKEADAGHWIPRGSMSVRFDEHNILGQCRPCNRLEYGRSEVMAIEIDKRWDGMTDWLSEQARIPQRFSISELKELLTEYQHKLFLVKTKLK